MRQYPGTMQYAVYASLPFGSLRSESQLPADSVEKQRVASAENDALN
jgi:hypothetical protein